MEEGILSFLSEKFSTLWITREGFKRLGMVCLQNAAHELFSKNDRTQRYHNFRKFRILVVLVHFHLHFWPIFQYTITVNYDSMLIKRLIDELLQ